MEKIHRARIEKGHGTSMPSPFPPILPRVHQPLSTWVFTQPQLIKSLATGDLTSKLCPFLRGEGVTQSSNMVASPANQP